LSVSHNSLINLYGIGGISNLVELNINFN